ncbi:MAG: hypothetical protein CVV05_11015 [Gammaproteobacteria bacterium HGW-Gammaproteobacteria-1]|jgi:hypothetical protein|nr:MAG: hypothetical protein CVV05_11015 [Gammaproteobacteria bacterium HGW-Gammaproteobacteria-1]
MAEGKGHIGFALPDQHKPGRDSFDTKPRKVEAWISQLPMGNVGETARQVFGALHESNRLRISWDERYRLLEALRGPVGYIGQALHKRFTGLTFPLQPKTQRIANLATELYGEMALGYKIAIEDMLARSFLFRDRKALTIMLHRALRYLNRVLLTTYQVYSPQPRETWADLHRLYRYAEERRLHQSSVTDKEQEILPKTSIATAYKQALLLALATPYRLRQGEVGVIYAALEIWAHLAQLTPYTSGANPEAPLFVTHLGSNEEPSHLAFNHFQCDDGQCRLIDLERLTLTVQDERDLIAAGTTTELKHRLGGSLNVDLLRRVGMTWDVPPKRGFYRSNKSSKAEVVVGLTAVHRALGLVSALRSITLLNSGDSGPENLFSKTSQFSSRVVAAESDVKEDVWDVFKPKPAAKPGQAQQAAPKTPALLMQTWEVRDESGGGYRIARSGGDTLGVQVGDLIAVRPLTDTHDANWVIGVVRWIRHSGPEELEMGVQNIANRSRPAAARMRQEGGKLTEFQRIIGLPEVKEPPQPQSLLAPPLLFGVGSTLLVQFDHTEHRLMLTGLLESTGSFSKFSFEDLGSTGATAPAKTDTHGGQPADYSNLWNDL